MQSVPPKIIVLAILGFAVIASLSTAFYTVPTESVGVITRFGKMKSDALQPGLHFKLPFGIDKVKIVPVLRQLKQEFGFGTRGSTNPTQSVGSVGQRAYSRRDIQFLQNEEKSMITGDSNEATVEWIIQYRINSPADYLFRARKPEETLRDVSESVMREVVGDRTVDEVLTVGRKAIEDEATVKMQSLVTKYELGLRINQIQLKNVNPPEEVQSSFNAVNEAKQQREQLINVAKKEYNTIVPKARGLADQDISQAKGYAQQRVNEAEGDASRFTAVFKEYSKAPEVTKRRLYLETLGEVVPALGDKIIMDEGAQQVLPLLQLSGGKK
jgi:modulator of FtsH protease HflK